MPCRQDCGSFPDPGTRANPTPATSYGLDLAEFEAALCGVLTVIENTNQLDKLLGKIDWKEAGVSRAKVEKWWAAHTAADKKRRQKEALKTAALGKLTPAERKALGL
jgi:hypothetical protein